MAGFLLAGLGLYGMKKIYDRLNDTPPNIGMMPQQQYTRFDWRHASRHQVQDARPWTSATMNDINRYFNQATEQQCLAMLVDGVYSRDRFKFDNFVLREFEKSYKEDARTEVYTKPDYYWTRMPQIGEEAEKAVGLRHYLQQPEAAAGQYNMNTNVVIRYRLVIALRGTKISNFQDIIDNIQVGHHTLHCSRRFKDTQDLIKRILSVFHQTYSGQPWQVCITGHSLGAAIALLIGKELAKDRRRRYDVHCFNPPFLSVLMIMKKCFSVDDAKDILRRCPTLTPFLKVASGVKDLGKMALVLLFGDHQRLWDELVHFVDLVDWEPVLYINKGDLICKEYRRFYEWKHKLNSDMPFMPIHMQTLVSRLVKENAKYSILVPSVRMVISQRDRHCHDLKQWYTDPTLESELRSYEMLHRDFASDLRDNGSTRSMIWNVIRNVIDSSRSRQPDLQEAIDAEALDPEYSDEMARHGHWLGLESESSSAPHTMYNPYMQQENLHHIYYQ